MDDGYNRLRGYILQVLRSSKIRQENEYVMENVTINCSLILLSYSLERGGEGGEVVLLTCSWYSLVWKASSFPCTMSSERYPATSSANTLIWSEGGDSDVLDVVIG